MAQQWLRKVSLVVGSQAGTGTQGLDLSEMHFRFEVRRGDIETPNSADITIFNLSDTTANRIMWPQTGPPEFTRVVLQAGYEGNFGKIFDGEIRQVRRGKFNPTDKYLNILAQDADFSYNFAVVSQTLAAGAGAQDQLATIAGAMGLPLGYVGELPNAQLSRGKVYWGMARDYLRQLARTCDATWSVQDGAIQLIPLAAYRPGEAPVLTAKTGLVGLPQQTQNGITARSLLNPGIKIGGLVKLDNKSIQGFKASLGYADLYNADTYKALVPSISADGTYRALIADHTGDTRGQEGYTDMILLSTDPSSPIPNIVARYG